jgi:hypothetical protein
MTHLTLSSLTTRVVIAGWIVASAGLQASLA